MRKTRLIATVAVIAAVVAMSTGALAKKEGKTGRGSGPVVYVPLQGLFYDSIVVADLPMHGRFQLLEMAGPSGLQTEFGLGDPGYLGGRWWLDLNGDGEMDAEDMFFLCPLLGPGRSTIDRL